MAQRDDGSLANRPDGHAEVDRRRESLGASLSRDLSQLDPPVVVRHSRAPHLAAARWSSVGRHVSLERSGWPRHALRVATRFSAGPAGGATEGTRTRSQLLALERRRIAGLGIAKRRRVDERWGHAGVARHVLQRFGLCPGRGVGQAKRMRPARCISLGRGAGRVRTCFRSPRS